MKDIRPRLLGELSFVTDTLELYNLDGTLNKDDLNIIHQLMRLYTAFDTFVTEQEATLRYKKEHNEKE